MGQRLHPCRRYILIWVSINLDYNCLSHIHLTKDELLRPHDWKGNLDLLNIVMIGITNEIPERSEDYELHRLIATLLSSELKEHEKLDDKGRYLD